MYRLRGYFEELLQALDVLKIRIKDICDEAMIGEGDTVVVAPAQGFSYRSLKALGQIIAAAEDYASTKVIEVRIHSP